MTSLAVRSPCRGPLLAALALCPFYRTYLSNICSILAKRTKIAEQSMTLEGVQRPRQGQPPSGGKKGKAGRLSGFSFRRRRSFGRRLRAPRIIGRCTARPPSARSAPAPCGARAPPPAWYTGAGHPADDRRPHARRAASLHGCGQSSPLEPVGSSCTRAGDTHGGRATVATALGYVLWAAKKPSAGVVQALKRTARPRPRAGVNGRYTIVTELAPSVGISYHDLCRVSSPVLQKWAFGPCPHHPDDGPGCQGRAAARPACLGLD